MRTIQQCMRRKFKDRRKVRKDKTVALNGKPQARGICTKVTTTTPKKPMIF